MENQTTLKVVHVLLNSTHYEQIMDRLDVIKQDIHMCMTNQWVLIEHNNKHLVEKMNTAKRLLDEVYEEIAQQQKDNLHFNT